jgi:hypothetical protein
MTDHWQEIENEGQPNPGRNAMYSGLRAKAKQPLHIDGVDVKKKFNNTHNSAVR